MQDEEKDPAGGTAPRGKTGAQADAGTQGEAGAQGDATPAHAVPEGGRPAAGAVSSSAEPGKAKAAPAPRARILYFSLLNVAACMGVVLLHTNGTFWEGPASPGWAVSNLIETLTYWPVPIFFMMSGALLIDYRRRMGTAEYLRRRFMRTVVPFLFWSLVAMAYAWWDARAHWAAFDASKHGMVNALVNTGYVPVYWFFPVLFGLYLCYPVLSAVHDQDKRRVFTYMAACALVFVSVLPLVFDLLHLQFSSAYAPVVAAGYMVYPLLGWLLAREDLGRGQRLAIYGLGVAGFAMQLLGTYFLSGPAGQVVSTFKGYTNLPAVLQSCAVFVLAKQAEPALRRLAARRPRAIALVNTAASLTFGVYLVHYYLVQQLPRVLGVDPHLLGWKLGGALLIFLVSAAAVWALRKVPGVRHVIP